MHSLLESAKRCRGCQRHVALSWIKQQARASARLAGTADYFCRADASHDTWLFQFEMMCASSSSTSSPQLLDQSRTLRINDSIALRDPDWAIA